MTDFTLSSRKYRDTRLGVRWVGGWGRREKNFVPSGTRTPKLLCPPEFSVSVI
jgi:hypothetical protein